MKCDWKSYRTIMAMLTAAFAASVATALADAADSTKPNASDEIKALREIIASNSVTRSTRPFRIVKARRWHERNR